MKYLLDANTCILLLMGVVPTLNARVLECDEGELGVSSIAFAEVALGSFNGKLPPMEVLDGFLKDVELLPFDEAAARVYSTLPFKRASFDRLIAAHAIALKLTLITSNERDFAAISGLKTENWTL